MKTDVEAQSRRSASFLQRPIIVQASLRGSVASGFQEPLTEPEHDATVAAAVVLDHAATTAASSPTAHVSHAASVPKLQIILDSRSILTTTTAELPRLPQHVTPR